MRTKVPYVRNRQKGRGRSRPAASAAGRACQMAYMPGDMHGSSFSEEGQVGTDMASMLHGRLAQGLHVRYPRLRDGPHPRAQEARSEGVRPFR